MNWIQKSNIVKYFWKYSFLAPFSPALKLSAYLIQITSFYFKLKFLVGKLRSTSTDKIFEKNSGFHVK